MRQACCRHQDFCAANAMPRLVRPWTIRSTLRMAPSSHRLDSGQASTTSRPAIAVTIPAAASAQASEPLAPAPPRANAGNTAQNEQNPDCQRQSGTCEERVGKSQDAGKRVEEAAKVHNTFGCSPVAARKPKSI